MRARIFFIFSICCLNFAHGQNFSITPTLDLDNFKRGISPQVALINRYGDYPVDLSNGLVDISIPLHTAQTAGLTIPFQLKFHASGLRADEREGLLGIRWALTGGGHVSRIIKGYADDFYPFNNQVSNPYYNPDFFTLFGTTGNKGEPGSNVPGNNSAFLSAWYDNSTYFPGGSYKDTEYDIFSYSLPSGKSGKFILKDINGTKVPCTMPFEPVQIYVNKNTFGRFVEVRIIDEDGTIYLFGEAGREQSGNNPGRYIDGDENGWATTWHLSSILSADKKDKILFDYKRTEQRAETRDRSWVISDNLHDNSELYYDGLMMWPLYTLLGNFFTDENYYFKENNNLIAMSQLPPYYMTSVQFENNGQLTGNVSFLYEENNTGDVKYLQGMTVTDAQGNIVKAIKFVLKNNQSNTLKLLDKIEFTDTLNPSDKEIYSFDYYDSPSVPACRDLSENSDWWGYYSVGGGWLRSVSDFAIYLPHNSLNLTNYFLYRDIPGGDKQSRAASMQIGMVQKIQYPTGGSTRFEYEANQRITGAVCGGLRIRRIINEPLPGKLEIKRYEYGNGQLPNYLLPPGERENLFSEIEMDCYIIIDHPHPVNHGYGKYIQRTYQNTFPSRFTDFRSNTVSYGQATEYVESASGESIGKTVYDYNVSLPILDYYDSPTGYNHFFGYNDYRHAYVSPRYFWKGNHLRSKTVYEGNRKVKEYLFGYTSYDKESVFDMPVYRYRHHLISINSVIYPSTGENAKREILMIHPSFKCSDCLSRTFAFKRQEYTIGADRLTSETENTYQPDGTKISVVKTRTYDPEFLLLINETITNSDGTAAIGYKYPFQCTQDPERGETYSDMTAKNILTPVVEKSVYKNGNVTERGITTYREWSPGAFAPEDYTYQQGYTAETRLRYYYNSRNRLQGIVKDGHRREIYIRDIYGQVLAVIEQATYPEVEAALGSAFIDRLAGSCTVNPTDMATLNQLRIQLPNAMVTTCSYAPMIGVVTVTDPKGVTTYYTYDGFNRLKETKNDDGHLLTSDKYKYNN